MKAKAKVRIIALLLCLALVTAACGTAAGPAGNDSGNGTKEISDMKFGVSLDTIDSQYWVSILSFIADRQAAQGFEVVQTVCEGDANRQNQQVEDMIAQGLDAILIGANDGASVAAAVQKCLEADIPVIMLGRAVVSDTIVPDAQVLVDNVAMMKDAMKWLAEDARSKGIEYNIALLIGSLSDQNAIERYDGAIAGIEANSDVLKVSTEIPTNWKPEQAFSGLQNAFQADPTINAVVTPSDFFFPTIQSVLQPLNRWVTWDDPDHVVLVGFDGDDGFARFIEDSFVDASAVNDTKFMADQTLDLAIQLVQGGTLTRVDFLDPGILATRDNWEQVRDGVWGYIAIKG